MREPVADAREHVQALLERGALTKRLRERSALERAHLEEARPADSGRGVERVEGDLLTQAAEDRAAAPEIHRRDDGEARAGTPASGGDRCNEWATVGTIEGVRAEGGEPIDGLADAVREDRGGSGLRDDSHGIRSKERREMLEPLRPARRRVDGALLSPV